MRRIVITGMGAICALGHDAPSTWKAMAEGRSGIGPIHHIEPGQLRNNAIAAEVTGYDPAKYFNEARRTLLDPFSEYALIAADEAIRQSGIRFEGEVGAR